MREFEVGGNHADLYRNDYTKEQNAQFTQAFGEITEAFKQAMIDGLNPSDAAVQELVAKHYEFCSQFWTPNRATYKSLALSYLLPSPYRDSYEAVHAGLAKYHYDAIVLWADSNLED